VVSIRTGHGKCNNMLFHWNIPENPSCECGAEKETIQHIVEKCPATLSGSNQKKNVQFKFVNLSPKSFCEIKKFIRLKNKVLLYYYRLKFQY
jgi:hypothetical protein